MKNKLGILSALILSLAMAGSALATVNLSKEKLNSNAALTATAKSKKSIPKKHGKHLKKHALKKTKT